MVPQLRSVDLTYDFVTSVPVTMSLVHSMILVPHVPSHRRLPMVTSCLTTFDT